MTDNRLLKVLYKVTPEENEKPMSPELVAHIESSIIETEETSLQKEIEYFKSISGKFQVANAWTSHSYRNSKELK
jgi:hypothetical protein